VKRFLVAHSKGELRIHKRGSRFPLEVGETVHDFWDLLEVSELDAWLRASVGYGFPKAVGAAGPTSAAQVAVTQEPAPNRGRRVKRAALIADNVRRWQTIERDLKDAATNGLSKAARDGAAVGWWWEGSAIEWARARAKVQDVASGLAGLTSRIHRMEG
jgi:type IV secretory pathway TrbL component